MFKKNRKIFLGVLICFSILSTTSISALAAENNAPTSQITVDYSTPHINVPLTDKEKLTSGKKQKESDDYVVKKRKSTSNEISTLSYGGSKILSGFPSYAQEKDFYCGPAAAYNAIKYKGISTSDSYGASLSQSTLANNNWLKTESIGSTNFDSRWPMTMNAWAYGNNYTRTSASGDSASWKNTLMNNVIYTIDKGYPVIADTKQHSGSSSVNLSSKYATSYYNGKDTYHYVVIYGYNDSTKTLYFSDSHSSFPGLYSISLDNMASLTDDFGIIW